ncbi:hypothetical protein [Paraburkholderia tropica]|uniref:hypothetical protein n=1 Tax=Paraburkholderia tropica TaxID=92647 RepID=UPI001F47080E|nr:hypothetical protein [Paraburkholderia tropica]
MDTKQLPDDLNPEVVKACAEFIGKITGLVPPPHDAFPPEWHGYLRTFTSRLYAVARENAATVAPAAVAPKAEFEDPRVQAVYNILCGDDDPPLGGDHWEGWVSRRIVDTLFAPTPTVAADAAAPSDMPDELPGANQDWATIAPSVAFHLIERHADNWAHAGQLMELWRSAVNARDAAAAQPDDRAAAVGRMEMFSGKHGLTWLVDPQSLPAGTHLYARAAAPQAALTDEQIVEFCADFCRANDMDPRTENRMAYALRAILATAPTECISDAVRECAWTYDDVDYKWDSACGQSWVFNDDGPAENNARFCQGCGGKIKIAARKAEIERSAQGDEA